MMVVVVGFYCDVINYQLMRRGRDMTALVLPTGSHSRAAVTKRYNLVPVEAQ